jgi:signal transduction histidine kinase
MDSQLAPDVRANRYDVLSRLADDLAHEIKNPLNAIVVNLEVMRRRIENGSTDAALERANVIEGEIRRVHGLVDQLLQLLRPSKGEAGPVAVDGVLDALAGAIQLQAKASRVDFSFASESSLYADIRPEALKFALLNLVSYAIDALADQDKGSVALRVTRGEQAIELTVECNAAVLNRSDDSLRLCSDLMAAAGGTMQYAGPQSGETGSTVILVVPPARFS